MREYREDLAKQAPPTPLPKTPEKNSNAFVVIYQTEEYRDRGVPLCIVFGSSRLNDANEAQTHFWRLICLNKGWTYSRAYFKENPSHEHLPHANFTANEGGYTAHPIYAPVTSDFFPGC